MKYKTAAAFRRALTDRLNERASRTGLAPNRLRKQVAFERFLARLFLQGDETWMLKGGYALELRFPGHSRTTRDLDLNIPPPPIADLLDALQRAAATDLGDHFEFILTAPTVRGDQVAPPLTGPPLGGYRFHVEARLDGRSFDRFPLDVGQGDVTVREPDLVAGQSDVAFADLETPMLPVYPLEDHFAEKLHAYTTPRENPSRVKDLVDMLLVIDVGLRPSALLRKSIDDTFDRYSRHPIPETLPVPPASWRGPFAALAAEVGLATQSTDEAYDRLDRFMSRVPS